MPHWCLALTPAYYVARCLGVPLAAAEWRLLSAGAGGGGGGGVLWFIRRDGGRKEEGGGARIWLMCGAILFLRERIMMIMLI